MDSKFLFQPVLPKHFTLKRKPKSAALRAELLQKSADAMSNMKKSTAPTVPVRSRGMPRKMTDTSKITNINLSNIKLQVKLVISRDIEIVTQSYSKTSVNLNKWVSHFLE